MVLSLVSMVDFSYSTKIKIHIIITIAIILSVGVLIGVLLHSWYISLDTTLKPLREPIFASERMENENHPKDWEYPLIEENSLLPISNPIYSPKVEDVDLKYDSLIACLIYYESKGNPNAIGDNGLAFGKLQFWKSTFYEYCQRYDMELDYYNSDHQIILADEMISRDWNNVYHWSTAERCLR